MCNTLFFYILPLLLPPPARCVFTWPFMSVFLSQGVENAVCVLRNLSFQLYTEIPPSALLRLEGPSRAQSSSKGEAIGCFTPNSKKAKDVRGCFQIPITVFIFKLHLHIILCLFFQRQNQDLTTFTEVSRQPKDIEWLWHPKIVELYNQVLQRCEINSTTREAAAGALQNITAGDKRVRDSPHISHVSTKAFLASRKCLAVSPPLLDCDWTAD